jgi:hypothetical protein
MRALAAAFVAAFLLAGCATFEDRPGAEVLVKATVQYATLKVVKDGERADRVADVTDTAIRLVEGDTAVALDELEAAVRKEIDFSKMKAEDVILVNALIGAVRLELQAVLGEDEMINPENAVAIATVLAWVKEAAQLRAGL